ncbi:hypothetical protein JW933_05240 [candidate division FCPU426 bacterium]|nr:hypothetical protein [candidate division FCPU426 bacterium]
MDRNQKDAFDDFTTVALCLLLACIVAVLLTSMTQLTARTVWPQLLFYQLLRAKSLSLWTVSLAPQAVVSPVMVPLYASMIPLGLHVLALVLLQPLVRGLGVFARLVYIFLSLVPVFGPIAVQTLLKSIGESRD